DVDCSEPDRQLAGEKAVGPETPNSGRCSWHRSMANTRARFQELGGVKMLGLLVVGAMTATASTANFVGQRCAPPECTPTLPAPPPWKGKSAIPLRGSEWLVGLPSDQLHKALRKDVALKDLSLPTAL